MFLKSFWHLAGFFMLGDVADWLSTALTSLSTHSNQWALVARRTRLAGTIVRMTESLPVFIEALRDPKAYRHPVQTVDVLQTHISWILLAGDFAYKIKKPVRLVFLDFSTLSLRHQYCMKELALNKRFAPDLYLDVVGIGQGEAGLCMETTGKPVEYAVRMRRFDEANRLDHVCERGGLSAEHLSGLADSMIRFYAQAPIAAGHSSYGELADIERQALDNFVDPLKSLTQAESQARLLRLREWTMEQTEALAPQFVKRKKNGLVRECHGDLHLANMVLLNGQVTVFDCIEFADDLRWIDVASDVAFVFVDLLSRSHTGLANGFLNEFLSKSGDVDALPVLRFYAVYRVMVRLKVACIRSEQTQSPDPAVETYLALAEALMRAKPEQLLITHGLSGCGKSSAARAWLQQNQPGLRLCFRADVERKRLFGLDELAQTHFGPGQGIYAEHASAQTYARLRELADSALRAGWSVVLDASFLKHSDRHQVGALARAAGVSFQILAPHAKPEELRRRIAARQAAAQDASEANAEVLERQMRVMEPLTAQERLAVLDIGN